LLFEIRLALRLLFTKPKGFYKAARFFTIGTIALSVAALLVSLSAFKGYLDVLKERYVDSTSDIVVSNEYGHPYEGGLKQKISSTLQKDFVDAKYFGYLELLVSSQKGVRGLAFEVLEDGSFEKVVSIKRYIKAGDAGCIFRDKGSVIVGVASASIMGLDIGSKLNVVYSGTNMENSQRSLTVCAIVDYGLYDLDSRLAYISLDTGRMLFPEAGFDSAVKVKLASTASLEGSASKLEDSLSIGTKVRTWKDMNYGMLESVKLDRLVIGFVLSVLIAVAIFNIIATLILLVRELRSEISMLQVLGMGTARVIRVFFFKAMILGVMGYVFGTGLWLLSIEAVKKWGIIALPADIYLVSQIPVEVGALELLFVLFVVLFFVCLGCAVPLFSLFRRFKKEGVYYGIRGQDAQ
jgi:lipoprotein-releasing system permease protein